MWWEQYAQSCGVVKAVEFSTRGGTLIFHVLFYSSLLYKDCSFCFQQHRTGCTCYKRMHLCVQIINL